MKVRYTFIMLATVFGLICSAQVQAQQVESFVADVTVSEEAVAFAIDGQYVGFVMTVSGPDAFYLERRFASDETPMLKAVSQEGTLADGPYNFEITAQPFLPEAARAELDKARAANDRAALQRQFAAAGVSPYAMVYTVTVGIAEGKFLNPVEEDDTAGQELGTNAKPGVVPGSIRLTGRRYQPDYQFAGQGAVAAPDATGAALQAVAQQNETLPPFGQHPATSADIWHEVMFENTAPDGTPLQFQGYVRPVMVNGGQILQAYFRELRPDDTTPDVWQPGFFRADESGFSLLALADVVQQATAAPLFDYVTDDAPMTEEEAAMRDQVFFDDIIVVGSACVGQDCSNGEAFGFDTLRLKENNLRIKAQDTSTSASFPTVDWQITFNDSSNGGQNKFAIDNIDGGRTPFTILDGAPSHSLYVDAQGDVGVGTSTPVVELHVKDGDSPTMRLEQDGSAGFQAQTWDMAGNETNFFIRDVTNSSKLPFRIRPNSPTSSIEMASTGIRFQGQSDAAANVFIASNGDFSARGDNQNPLLFTDADAASGAGGVGIGTDTPTGRLQVESTGTNSNVILARRSGTTNTIFRVFEDGAGNALVDVRTAAGNRAVEMTGLGDGRISVGCNTPQHDLDLGNDPAGACSAAPSRSFIDAGATAFTASSSRLLKENFVPMQVDGILDKILNVGVYEYDFIEGPENKMGLMAEDFHTIFGRGSDKLLNGQEVDMALWLAVQELAQRNKTLQAEKNALEARLDRIEALLNAQQH